MILNNLKKILLSGIMNSNNTANNVPSFNGVTLVDEDGNDQNITSANYSNNSSRQNSIVNALNHAATTATSGTLTLKVGNGTTAPAENDYRMENENPNLTINSISTTFTANLTKVYTATIGNSTQNDIDITEIGVFITDSYSNSIMIEHTVKTTPITINAGQNKAITIELSM